MKEGNIILKKCISHINKYDRRDFIRYIGIDIEEGIVYVNPNPQEVDMTQGLTLYLDENFRILGMSRNGKMVTDKDITNTYFVDLKYIPKYEIERRLAYVLFIPTKNVKVKVKGKYELEEKRKTLNPDKRVFKQDLKKKLSLKVYNEYNNRDGEIMQHLLDIINRHLFDGEFPKPLGTFGKENPIELLSWVSQIYRKYLNSKKNYIDMCELYGENSKSSYLKEKYLEVAENFYEIFSIYRKLLEFYGE